MHGPYGSLDIANTRRVQAEIMTQPGNAPGLGDGRRTMQAITQSLHHHFGVVGKPVHDIGVTPAAFFRQHGG